MITPSQHVGLTNIEIPNSIEKIGRFAFTDTYSLNEIIIPESVTEVEMGAFSSCENLNKVVILNNVMSIENSAFNKNDNLTIYCKSDSTAKTYAVQNEINYILDDDAPTITALKQEDKYINITATDNNGVGLADEAYSLDNKNWSSSNKLAVEKSGTYTVYVRDMLGNTATKTIDVVIAEIDDSNKSGKDDNSSGEKENGDADKTTNSETEEHKKSDIKTSTETTKDKTQAKTVIPQAGATFPIIILTAISIICFVVYKKFKKINY